MSAPGHWTIGTACSAGCQLLLRQLVRYGRVDTEYSKRQFVQVDILFRKSQNFTGPKPRVKNSKRNKPRTKKSLTFGGAGVNKILNSLG